MAWVSPSNRTTGTLITAAIWNQDVVANPIALYANHVQQVFRGLQVRTHPDSDSWKTKVMLVHADEIVFDDGTRIAAGLDRLVADITVAGAGGLDTGAEGASRWYEAYCIRKSSDGTLNLLLHRAKDWTSDTSFLTASDATRALRLLTATATDKLAQGVQFANSKPVPFIDIYLATNTTPVAGNIWLTLESDTAGSPSGVALATSDKLDGSLVSAVGQQLVRFAFRTPYTVTATTQYHVVLQGDYTRSDTVTILWYGVAAGGYANGSGKQYNGAAWAAATGVGDFRFNAYTELNNVAVTMPAGYNQKCLVGSVRNDGGSDFVPFIAIDRDVKYRDPSALVSGGAATFQTLVDLAAIVPPGPVVGTSWELENTGLNNIQVASALGQSGHVYGIYVDEPRAAAFIDTGAVVPIENQSLYYMVAAGACTIYLRSFRW